MAYLRHGVDMQKKNMEYKEETKNCQNCKKDFTIESDDFLFYEKIKVPPPTFCSYCRFARRMIWRNERSLHKRKCSMCDKNIVSLYDDQPTFQVFCSNCYRSDKWEAGEFSQDYRFDEPFFKQFKELFLKVSREALYQNNSIDSEYSNFVLNSKNVYLAFSVLNDCENVYFASNVDGSKQIVDSYNIASSELIYEGMGINKSYNCQYSYWPSSCIDCNFILDCNNCQDCFGCVNLQNKRYCILNEQYTKEQYEEKLEEFNMGSYSFVENFKKEFWEFSLKFPRKYARITNCIDSTGDEIRNSNNTRNSFTCYGNENLKYGYRSPYSKDSMDVGHCWAEFAYEHALSGSENSQNVKFIINGGIGLKDVEYLDYCKSSSNLFG
ncbi:MAG: hypothetical protein HXX18_15035, partial [Bacteroidetes bacterium]|nr:hypothetical protein [Bacteroidota bacterium]